MLSVLSGVFLASLDQTIVSTALPKIVASLSGIEFYSWVVSAYLLTSTATVIIYGKLSDIYGRKRLFILGIIIFLAGSAMSGLSQNIFELIIFRALQGIGGGAIMVNAISIIADLFPPAERGKWQGATGLVFGLSSVIGPLLGGFITDAISWHWIFFINIPIGIFSIFVLSRFLPSVSPVNETIDFRGSAVLIVAITVTMLALLTGGVHYPWLSAPILGMLAFSALMFYTFARIESGAKHPVLPPSIFRNRIFLVSIVVIFITSMVMLGSVIFIPLYFQAALGKSATVSGIMMLPLVFFMVASSAVSGQIISRSGRYKPVAIVGMLLATAGLFLLSFISPSTPDAQLLAGMAILGTGLGTSFPVFTIAVQNSVEHSKVGTATASMQFFRNMGGLIGTSLFGSLIIFLIIGNPLIAGMSVHDLENLLETGSLPDSGGSTGIDAVKSAFSSSLSVIFLISAVLSLIAFIVSLFLKEIPLRKTNAPALESIGMELASESGCTPKEQ
jgi:EmrB/QacA subfamily drug resistance transporter